MDNRAESLRRMGIENLAAANVPTKHGELRVIVFDDLGDGKEHVAIVHGDVNGAKGVPVRVHSACITSEVFGSLKCDCREQLQYALDYVADAPKGVVLYLRQEGRGIGLANKIRAYSLQEQGLDTVDANRALGLGDDLRDYGVAVEMLSRLGIKSIRLMTNNPLKVEGLTKRGVKIDGRLPVLVDHDQHAEDYLQTKAERMGHIIPIND